MKKYIYLLMCNIHIKSHTTSLSRTWRVLPSSSTLRRSSSTSLGGHSTSGTDWLAVAVDDRVSSPTWDLSWDNCFNWSQTWLCSWSLSCVSSCIRDTQQCYNNSSKHAVLQYCWLMFRVDIGASARLNNIWSDVDRNHTQSSTGLWHAQKLKQLDRKSLTVWVSQEHSNEQTATRVATGAAVSNQHPTL